jgi:hypothetical protein
LDDKKVGISISYNPDSKKFGYSEMHIQDASIEFARYLLVHGATLIYAGDLRPGGFTYLFSELTKLYSTKENCRKFRFINYMAWPLYLGMSRATELDFRQNNVEIKKLPLPPGLPAEAEKYTSWDSYEAKVVWAKSFFFMRETMDKETDVRIFIGGKTREFKSTLPGIVEECLLALRSDKPVYLIGAYGGATKEIVDLILQKPSKVLTEEYQLADSVYKDFFTHWNKTQKEKVVYAPVAEFFRQYGIERIAKNNGLTEEENLTLFKSNNLTEMVFLVLKGLHELKRDRNNAF